MMGGGVLLFESGDDIDGKDGFWKVFFSLEQGIKPLLLSGIGISYTRLVNDVKH